MATYTYWWFGGALKCPGRTEIPWMSGAAVSATATFSTTATF